MVEEKYTVEYLYLGERIDYVGNIRQVFRCKKGDLHYWQGIGGLCFGESYLVTKDGKIKKRWPPKPEKQTLFATEKEQLDFETQKLIVAHQREARKKFNDSKKPHRDIVRAIELLRPFVRNDDLLTLNRFVDYLKNQLTKKKKK